MDAGLAIQLAQNRTLPWQPLPLLVRHRLDVVVIADRGGLGPRANPKRFPRFGIEILSNHPRSIALVLPLMGRRMPTHRFLAGRGDVIGDFATQIRRAVVAAAIRHWQTIAKWSDQIVPRMDRLRLAVRMMR